MISDPTTLKQAVKQAIEEINDACYELREDGVICLLPEDVEIEVQLVTEVNAINRTSSETENEGGSSVTLRQVLGDDVETTYRSGDKSTNVRGSLGTSETTTITHPAVQTLGSGADTSSEEVVYTYKDEA